VNRQLTFPLAQPAQSFLSGLFHLSRIERAIQGEAMPITAPNQRDMTVPLGQNVHRGVFQSVIAPDPVDKGQIEKSHEVLLAKVVALLYHKVMTQQ
jgi:hypothetical protein